MPGRLALPIFAGLLALSGCGGEQGTCTVRFEGIVIRAEENIGAGDCEELCVQNQTCEWVATTAQAEILHP